MESAWFPLRPCFVNNSSFLNSCMFGPAGHMKQQIFFRDSEVIDFAQSPPDFN